MRLATPWAVLMVAAVAFLPGLGSSGILAMPNLRVGWRDEFGPGASRRWKWDPPRGAAELAEPRPGILRLRLAGTSESGQTPESPPRTYYWASAYRYLSVDLDRYPVLAIRVAGVRGKETWWDAIVQEYTGGSGFGKEMRASLKDAQVPGILLFDVPAETGLHGRRRLRLRLNIAGITMGGWADYDYVRFVSREGRDILRENPSRQRVRPAP